MSNKVCEILNIKYPVIQGPMAWTANPSLVAAVSNAGGMGTLGCGFAPAEVIRDQIRATKTLTDKPFGANIFMAPPVLEMNGPTLLEEKPPVVYADILAGLDYDLAKKYFDLWHENGMKIVFKASFISDAVIADKAGADVIIVKGWEGGGHTSEETTMVLVPQAADLISAPVVACGGIADGRGMAAGFCLGAVGIEMGSAFLLAKECDIAENVKDRIIHTGDMETVITGYCTGEPSRQIKNKLSDRLVALEADYNKAEAAARFGEPCEGSLRKAMTEGNIDYGAIMIGQIVPVLKEIRTAEDIIVSTVRGCEKILGYEVC
ncbi:MAG: nitronate monooxygenase [Clostridiales bacterium]|nr:nitronate monooxygenase [Clostridiales bacterium]